MASNLMSLNGETWIVTLSDGRMFEEGALCDEPRRISPWGKLREIMDTDGVYITVLMVAVLDRLYTAPVRSITKTRHGPYDPVDYLCMRKQQVDGLGPGRTAVSGQWIGMQTELRNGLKLTQWICVNTGRSIIDMSM